MSAFWILEFKARVSEGIFPCVFVRYQTDWRIEKTQRLDLLVARIVEFSFYGTLNREVLVARTVKTNIIGGLQVPEVWRFIIPVVNG